MAIFDPPRLSPLGKTGYHLRWDIISARNDYWLCRKPLFAQTNTSQTTNMGTERSRK